jgi:hypothetical protein
LTDGCVGSFNVGTTTTTSNKTGTKGKKDEYGKNS